MMEEKHKIFIESMVRMGKEFPEFVKPLKSITKCYIINEGVDFKGFVNKAKNFIMQDPTKVDIPQTNGLTLYDKNLLEIDKNEFNADYSKFLNALHALTEFIRVHGTKFFEECTKTSEFRNAIKMGEYLEKLKERAGSTNLVAEAIDKSMKFVAVLESVAAIGYPLLAKSVFDTYCLTENAYGISTQYLVESSFKDAVLSKQPTKGVDSRITPDYIKNTVIPTIAKFISRHGVMPWTRYLKSENFKWAVTWGDIMKNSESMMRTSANDTV